MHSTVNATLPIRLCKQIIVSIGYNIYRIQQVTQGVKCKLCINPNSKL